MGHDGKQLIADRKLRRFIHWIISWQETNQPRTASDQNIHNACCNFVDTVQRALWHGHHVSYRREVKNDGNNRKARDDVEHIFSDRRQHNPPPVDQI
jgi:hypothetical protein